METLNAAEIAAELDLLRGQMATLVAKQEISEVLYRYARGVDRADLELLRSCYHPDAIDAHWTFIGNAREFAEVVLSPRQMGQVPIFKHYVTNVLIDLDGDRAFCESCYLFTQSVPLDEERNAAMTSEGRYLDLFERRDGRWRILYRLLVGELGGWWLPIPVPRQPNRPLPDARQRAGRYPDDPVYRGFAIGDVLPPAFSSDDDIWEAARQHLRAVADRIPAGA